jgi:hypothetical protein
MHASDRAGSVADLTLISTPTATSSLPASTSPAPTGSVGRVRQAAPFVLVGVGCVIAGGLTAAVTAHAPTEHATWAAAYLVLVAGLAQVALGLGRAYLSEDAPTPVRLGTELVVWNLGNAAVIVGTLTGLPVLTDAGGVLLVVALVLFGFAAGRGPGWARAAYRAVIVVLAVSIPVGLVLAALNNR